MDIPLTIIIPNRDRMCFRSKHTDYLFQSLLKQTNNMFYVSIIDGGSKNYYELSRYIKRLNNSRFSISQTPISGKFHKTFLNNIAIKKCKTPYALTTDADILFSKDFIDLVINSLTPNSFIESRTFYLNKSATSKIHNRELNPFVNLEACKMGRLKSRNTPGGCQCGHMNIWEKIRGYDERYIGWGSEDVDLVKRIVLAGYSIKWLGETIKSVMVFHQDHEKVSIEENLIDQSKNRVFYENATEYAANPNGWGCEVANRRII